MQNSSLGVWMCVCKCLFVRVVCVDGWIAGGRTPSSEIGDWYTAQLLPSLVCFAPRPSFFSKQIAGPIGRHHYLYFLVKRDLKILEILKNIWTSVVRSGHWVSSLNVPFICPLCIPSFPKYPQSTLWIKGNHWVNVYGATFPYKELWQVPIPQGKTQVSLF